LDDKVKMAFTMGQKVEALRGDVWQVGTVLGCHPDDAYDIVYDGGEGDMMKPGGELRMVEVSENLQGVGNEEANKAERKKKKKCGVGWTGGGGGEEVREEGGDKVAVAAGQLVGGEGRGQDTLYN